MRSNNTPFNVLVSYAYTGRDKAFNDLAVSISLNGTANVMLDSGAFTIHNAKKRSDLTLDTYCDYLEANADAFEKYVMLDVIRSEAKTKANYEAMVERGFNPMFVFTEHDDDWGYLDDVIDHQPHVCVAGGVTNKGDWMVKRYQDVFRTNNKALIHGLGFVKYPDMYRVPIHSVDSSSWIQGGAVYGNLAYFDNGIKSVNPRSLFSRAKAMPHALAVLLEKLEITPTMLSEPANMRANGINALTGMVANFDYQRYSKGCGINLFLAVASTYNLKMLCFAQEQWAAGTLTFASFKKFLETR